MSSVRVVLWFANVIVSLCAFGSPGRADVIQTGESCIPGAPGKVVDYTVRYRKVPTNSTHQIQCWIDARLRNPVAGDDVRFVICAMINVNKPKVTLPRNRADLSGGTWTCAALAGTINWHPNYHFGCRRVRLHAGNGHRQFVVDDVTANFSAAFEEADIAAAYIDVAADCPNGFSGCGAVFDQTDRWLEPGDGLFPNNTTNCAAGGGGTSSFWIMHGGAPSKCPDPEFPLIHMAESLIPIGNWYTMAYPLQEFPSRLDGRLVNAPIGALLEIEFPAAVGAEPFSERVTSDGQGGSIVRFSIPYTITPELFGEPDEHFRLRISYQSSDEQPAQLPDPDAVMRLDAESIATGTSFFPNDEALFAPGDFMHGVLAQYPLEYEPPFIVEQRLERTNPTAYEIFVEAGDDMTMVVAAAFAYTIDGVPQPDVAIEWDDEPINGNNSRFRATIGPLAEGEDIDSYEIRIVDDSGNLGVHSFRLDPEPEFVRGDVNDDGKVDIADAVWIINELFLNGPETHCQKASDVNGDGLGPDVSDAAYIIGYRFLDGPSPPVPFPECGLDSSEDSLTCAAFESCPR